MMRASSFIRSARRMHSEWTVEGDNSGIRLDKFLAASHRLGSRRRAISAIERGKVLVNGAEVGVSAAARRLRPGDVVRLWFDRPGSAKPPRIKTVGEIRILHEDDSLIVVDKPPRLLAVPLPRRENAPSVYGLLRDHLSSRGGRRPFVVHRIDRDTSGLVIFARNARAQLHLKSQFVHREPERVYLALVYGVPDPPEGTWHDHLVWDGAALRQKRGHVRDPRAREAISEYRVLEAFPGVSLIEVRLHTGKRNQIRVQARLRGHPLVGERQYVSCSDRPGAIAFGRQALHAHMLKFRHPRDGRELRFEAPLPADMAQLIDRLRERRRWLRSPDNDHGPGPR
jgi:23S rRNA pseudouridine1911/1915/1917 synthase